MKFEEMLMKNKCPSCEKDFTKCIAVTNSGHIICNCGFTMLMTQYREIVANRVPEWNLPDDDEDTTPPLPRKARAKGEGGGYAR